MESQLVGAQICALVCGRARRYAIARNGGGQFVEEWLETSPYFLRRITCNGEDCARAVAA
jgi:hypothetical protein